MKRFQLAENNFATAQVVAEILETYANDGTRENEVVARMMVALAPGQEGPLRYTIWVKLPTDYRQALIEVVGGIESLAWKWRLEYQQDWIRPTIQVIKYLVELLEKRRSVTITNFSDFDPPTVTLRASGYNDKTVLLGSFLLAVTAMGLQLGTVAEDILLYV